MFGSYSLPIMKKKKHLFLSRIGEKKSTPMQITKSNINTSLILIYTTCSIRRLRPIFASKKKKKR